MLVLFLLNSGKGLAMKKKVRLISWPKTLRVIADLGWDPKLFVKRWEEIGKRRERPSKPLTAAQRRAVDRYLETRSFEEFCNTLKITRSAGDALLGRALRQMTIELTRENLRLRNELPAGEGESEVQETE
jgi:hypothetical protein